MQPDAVQIQNKPFECRFILLGALRDYVRVQKGEDSPKDDLFGDSFVDRDTTGQTVSQEWIEI